MYVSVKELILKSEKATLNSCLLYERLGLIATFDPSDPSIKVSSCEDAAIISVDTSINIEIYSKKHLNQLIEDGFFKADDDKVTILDDVGNKLLVSFNPKKSLKRIAVLTSGGDAPGMNSAIRAIIRTGIKWGSKVYGVFCGYEGLIEDMIEELEWDRLNKHACDGGTFLQSARSKRFMAREGRKQAVFNLVKRNIGGLIVIGGDGSLTGALILKNEFKGFVNELIAEGKLEKDSVDEDLSIITIPASIDNDIPLADTTIGSDSALHRVIESVDTLTTTMESHRRAIVIEVMGRHCGWIALMSAVATAADYVFLPERPADWKTESVNAIKKARKFGKRGVFLVLSEGAVDINGEIIKPEEVKSLLEKNDIETRILRLGHLQRGGAPSAFDRIQATLLGCKAVEILLTRYNIEPIMMADQKGEIKAVPLIEVIKKCEEQDKKRLSKSFDFLFDSRNSFFKKTYQLSEKLRKGSKAQFQLDSKIPQSSSSHYAQDMGEDRKTEILQNNTKDKECTGIENININEINANNKDIEKQENNEFTTKTDNEPFTTQSNIYKKKRIAILHEGKRAGGMNVALNAIVQYGLSCDQEIIVITDGFDGLVNNQIVESHQYEFISGIHDGGSLIGSSPSNIDSIENIYYKLIEHRIDSLIVVGGYESLVALYNIQKIMENKFKDENEKDENYTPKGNNTKHNKALKNDKDLHLKKMIDLILIPSTTDNNIPLTDITIGSDTALNTIMRSCDYLKLSTISMKQSVFIVEVGGENCGYLSLMSGIASGALEAFIPERKYMISHLSEIAQRLRHRFKNKKDLNVCNIKNDENTEKKNEELVNKKTNINSLKRNGVLLIRNENTFNKIDTKSLGKILSTDSSDRFNTKFCVLGYLQRGGNPSPIDRVFSTIFGVEAIDLLLEKEEYQNVESIEKEKNIREIETMNGNRKHNDKDVKNNDGYNNSLGIKNINGMVGINQQDITFSSLEKVMERFDIKKKRDKNPKWLVYSNICRSWE
ncbi:Phosfructokinase [Spraguea lophii 42_110]|uniref:6-phosphofructokinase n=1 Tax=Spraguea lophii (strain 42_110) TaxID=1358809 RepID=S7WAX1_SPRLO|nr:Phosfructokinase [Spraguea lophii 42_110]